ncbi:hypothetical protein SAMN05216271_0452 [Halopseudomonas sabulinigri]|uniref:Uncharacterized protein n=1 Tax=Halopseudomonas sabulinigri TaxID=472181 RepID=A0A1H1M1S8_9GAMM|nr:hypothetical protein SAMN05216271_0452 [Halopseudomonas sabulinigri]
MSTEAIFIITVCGVLAAVAVMGSVGFRIACKLDSKQSEEDERRRIGNNRYQQG